MTRDINNNNNNNNNNINICKAHIVSIRAESEAQYGISAHLYVCLSDFGQNGCTWSNFFQHLHGTAFIRVI